MESAMLLWNYRTKAEYCADSQLKDGAKQAALLEYESHHPQDMLDSCHGW